MKQKIEKIRSDLRELRKLTHAINAMLDLKKSREERRTYLVSLGTPEVCSEIDHIDTVLRTLKIEQIIAEASALELKYMSAINTLESIDKTIILEGYINGVPFWKIGKQLGYSEDGIKKRAHRALLRLAEIL